ncbi:MAG: hypothetical protein ACO2PN_09665 [Pyrobaculum sp.]|jgi:hypothetical protein
MGRFQTEADVETLTVIVSAVIAVWTALLLQYAIVFFAAAMATWMLRPLRK